VAVDEIFRPGGSGVEDVCFQPPSRISGRFAIESEEAALGRYDYFVSRCFAGLEELF
jgi:hypothetical protein